MGKRESELTEEKEIRNILEEAKVVHIGLADGDEPYVISMNYGYAYENGKLTIYVHGAKDGYKYEVIRKNPKVSFSMECDVVPFAGEKACQYGTTYSVVSGKGNAVIVSDVEEKERALTLLMKTQTGKDFTFDEKLVSIVNVVRIDVTEFSARKRPLPGQK